MAKYKIWNKTDTIYTLVGEQLTPQQWLARYPWAALDGVKMIIGGGVINGTVAMEFDSTIDMYEKMGVDFSECTTDQSYLDTIEQWENTPQTPAEPTAEERTAAALESILESIASGTTGENTAALDALLTGEDAQ